MHWGGGGEGRIEEQTEVSFIFSCFFFFSLDKRDRLGCMDG